MSQSAGPRSSNSSRDRSAIARRSAPACVTVTALAIFVLPWAKRAMIDLSCRVGWRQSNECCSTGAGPQERAQHDALASVRVVEPDAHAPVSSAIPMRDWCHMTDLALEAQACALGQNERDADGHADGRRLGRADRQPILTQVFRVEAPHRLPGRAAQKCRELHGHARRAALLEEPELHPLLGPLGCNLREIAVELEPGGLGEELVDDAAIDQLFERGRLA